jgi:hypothetical protein
MPVGVLRHSVISLPQIIISEVTPRYLRTLPRDGRTFFSPKEPTKDSVFCKSVDLTDSWGLRETYIRQLYDGTTKNTFDRCI